MDSTCGKSVKNESNMRKICKKRTYQWRIWKALITKNFSGKTYLS